MQQAPRIEMVADNLERISQEWFSQKHAAREA